MKYPLVSALLLLSTAAHAQPLATFKARILTELKTDLFPTLPPGAQERMMDKVTVITLPDESPFHNESIFWNDSNALTIAPSKDGIRGHWDTEYSSHLNLRILKTGTPVISQQECLQRGETVLKTIFPSFFQKPLPPVKIATPNQESIWKKGGEWYFSWQRHDAEGFPNSRAAVTIRAVDGKVTGFSCGAKREALWKHTISPGQAVAKAIRATAEKNIGGITAVDWYSLEDGRRHFYRIDLEAHSLKSGIGFYNQVEVDAFNGHAQLSEGGWGTKANPFKAPLINDNSPIWTKNGLLFASNRPFAGMPPWANFNFQAVLRDNAGHLSHLSEDFQEFPFELNGLPNSSWVGFDRLGWVYALDLETGASRVLARTITEGHAPAIAPDGDLSIVDWMQGGNTDDGDDFRAAHLASPTPFNTAIPVLIPGQQGASVFSPDGQWLYYVTQTAATKDVSDFTIDRFPTSALSQSATAGQDLVLVSRHGSTSKAAPNSPSTPSQIVASSTGRSLGYEEIERLTISPSGDWLLAQTDHGLLRVDIAAHKATPIILARLRDPEQKTALNIWNDACAGPGNDELTFSANTRDSKGITRRLIYSCRLDGTHLRAWTSPANTPLPAYTFPTTRISAATLAAQWATDEIKTDRAAANRKAK